MSKTCILLTCEYPYITGEPFLENEMQYLSDSFDEIYLFAVNASGNMKMTRKVPENVRVYTVGCLLSKMRYPVYCTKGLFCREKELPVIKKDLKGIITSLYARGRSDVVYQQILETIARDGLDVSDTVVYSYWFTDQAVVAWRLKKHLAARGSKVKAVCRAHGYDLYWERNPMGFLPYQDVTLKNMDGVYPCSDNGVAYLVGKYPACAGNLHTARLGTLDHGCRETANTKTVVTCCSLYKIKRISMFARAFQAVCQKVPDCHWVCIGDGDEFEWLTQFVAENHLEDRITLMGRLPNRDVIAYYQTHDVAFFSNVSVFEGVPVCVMEALSFGIPVVATAAGGTGELVCGENGNLLDVFIEETQLAQALEEAFSMDAALYAQKRAAARRTWEEKSSAEKNYTDWCRILLD